MLPYHLVVKGEQIGHILKLSCFNKGFTFDIYTEVNNKQKYLCLFLVKTSRSSSSLCFVVAVAVVDVVVVFISLL